MTEIIRVRGIKRVKSHGRWYYYHRKTGQRIKATPGTPAFLAEVERLDTRAAAEQRDDTRKSRTRP